MDMEGVIEPDTDEPQEMGEIDNIEVNFLSIFYWSSIQLRKYIEYLFTVPGLEKTHGALTSLGGSSVNICAFISSGHRGDDGRGRWEEDGGH